MADSKLTGQGSLPAGTDARAAVVGGALAIAIGALVLLGWAIDSGSLKSLAPELPEMKAITAVSLMFVGEAVIVLACVRERRLRLVGKALGTITATLATIVLVEWIFDVRIVDELVFDDPTAADPGRPSAHTALGLLLISLAVVSVDLDPPRYRWLGGLVVATGIVVLAALAGYSYEVDYLRGSGDGAGMSVQSIAGLTVLTISAALLRPGSGVLGFLRGGDAGARIARIVLPIALLAPVLLGLMRLQGQELGLFNLREGVALTTLSSMLILLAVLAFAALRLREESNERDEAEAGLAAAARHFDLSHDLLCTASFDGYFEQLNPAFTQALGWSEGELRGRPFVSFVHLDDRARTTAETRKLAEGSATIDFVNRYETKEGGWRWLEWTATAEAESNRIYAAARDITERVEVEQQLERERFELARAQQTASLGSWRWDLRTGLVEWSEQNFRNHGREPAESAPTIEELLALVHPEDRDAVAIQLRDSAAHPGEFTTEYRVVHPDSSTHVLELKGEPYANGAVLAGTSRDVTIERESERLKDDFFNLISHELRTPLTSIIGYTELLAEIEADSLSEEGRKFLEVIDRNSRRELELVGDLLMLTRIEAGTFKIEKGEANLTRIVEDVVEEALPAAQRHGVELVVETLPTASFSGDAHRLGQVITNLISNAIKFTPEGGSVSASVQAIPRDRVRFTVSDTGIGIPEREQGKLFERMYRAEEAERQHIPGTGLGLTIVKAIVEAHGGEVSLESVVGEGSTFTVDLPLARAPLDASGTGTELPDAVSL